MTRFKFRFNKKRIYMDIDETQSYRHYGEGWLSVSIFALEQIKLSDIFTELEKSNISNLTMFQLYRMLKIVNK